MTPPPTKPLFPWKGMLLALLLALLCSAFPLLAGFLLNKSSLPLGYLQAWYPFVPPLLLLGFGLWMWRREASWMRRLGLAWLATMLWFGLQAIFGVLTTVHLVFRLLALPTTAAGGSTPFVAGFAIFLVGGVCLWLFGGRAPALPARAPLALVLLVALVGLPLVGTFSARPASASAPAPALPSQDEIFRYISDVYNMGDRRPGSAADLKAITYLEAKFREFGYQDVRVESTKFDYWEAVKWGLSVQPGSATAWDAEPFYVPYSGPTKPDGITAEVVDLGNISAPRWQDVTGKIVLVDVPAVDISWDQMKLFTYLAYDPENSTKGWHHPYPIGWGQKFVPFYKEVETRHPAGIIAILRDYPIMGKFTYYCPYDGEMRSIPSLYLLSGDGDRLKAEIAKGKTSVKLTLDAKVAPKGGESANVYAVLPGKSSETLMIHSHHDAPFRSGVEDSSGVGMVLALARYYNQVPLEQRERTLVFLLTGAHMAGGPTNQDFIARHKDGLLKNTLFDIAIEHVADDYNPPAAATGKVEPRGIFISENPVLISQLMAAVAANNMTRTLVFSTGTPLSVPTDANPYFRAGTPIVSLISGPSWLFDDDDTLERVAKWELAPLAGMYVDFIARLNGFPAWLLHFNPGWAALLLALVLSPLAARAGRP